MRYRPPSGVPLYGITASRRRGKLRGSRLLLVIVSAVVIVGVLVAVTMLAFGKSGSGTSDPHAPAPSRPSGGAGPGHTQVRAAAQARRHHRRAHAGSADARAIDHVLTYTPFIASGTSRKRVMALTFDDGPSPYTPSIVQALVRMRVPATFFVVGQQLQYFSAGLKDELRHGFAIGDHTQNHAWLIRLSAAGQYAQVADDAAELQTLGVPRPRLFRPPYGAFNAETMTVLHRFGMLMVMWSIDPGDWRRPGRAAIVANVLGNSRPGAIVIMHDGGGDRSQTLAALPAIVHGLRRRGYRLVTVPQLLALDPPPRHQPLPHLSGV